MYDFNRRIDEIYPKEIFSLVIITIFSIIAFMFAYNLEVLVTPLTTLVIFIFLYTVYRTVSVQVIRYKIYKSIRISKKEFYAYMVKRVHKERRKVRIFSRKDLLTKEQLINELVLDLKKDLISLKGIVDER